MHDAVELEARGIPAAVVVTTEFEHESHVQRTALGMDGLNPVVITHPLSTLTPEQIASRVTEAATGARAMWQGA